MSRPQERPFVLATALGCREGGIAADCIDCIRFPAEAKTHRNRGPEAEAASQSKACLCAYTGRVQPWSCATRAQGPHSRKARAASVLCAPCAGAAQHGSVLRSGEGSVWSVLWPLTSSRKNATNRRSSTLAHNRLHTSTLQSPSHQHTNTHKHTIGPTQAHSDAA